MPPETVEIIRLVQENENVKCQEEWEMANKLDINFMKNSFKDDFNLPKSK